VRVLAELSFIDQVERQDPRYIRTGRVYKGYSRFMEREAFENSEHLKFDCFTIRLDLIVIEEGRQQ
jgi:speckle-type POZ protein